MTSQVKSFKAISIEEDMKIPQLESEARHVQRYTPNRSIEFDFDSKSAEYLQSRFPLKCNFTTLKKVAENLILLNRLYYRKTDVPRIDLLGSGNWDNSYYYKEKQI